MCFLYFYMIDWLIDWLIDWCLTSSEHFSAIFRTRTFKNLNATGLETRKGVWVGTDNLASATGLIMSILLIMSCYSTLGSLTCEEDGNLSTRDLGFIYVSSEGRVGCEFIHPAQPTNAPSSRRSSRIWWHDVIIISYEKTVIKS